MTAPSPRPAPYPAKTAAKGWRFELVYEAIEQSDTWPLAAEIPLCQHALLMMWLVAWMQVPCGSLPADEDLIRAKCRIPVEVWPAMRAVMMRGWWLADDGRLYHNTLVKRVEEMMARRRSDADRQAKRRGRVTPDTEPPSPENPPGAPGGHDDVTRDTAVSRAGVPPESSTDNRQPNTVVTEVDFSGRSARARASPSPAVGFADTKAGEVGRAFERAGLPAASINLADPRLAALIAQGATPEEFEGLAREALRKRVDDAYAWTLAVLPKRREDAAAIAMAPKAAVTVAENPDVERTLAALAEQDRHRKEAAAETRKRWADILAAREAEKGQQA